MTPLIATYNLGDGPNSVKTRDLRELADRGVIIAGLQEAGDRRRMKLPKGWKRYGPRRYRGAASVPIIWDPTMVRATRKRSILAVKRTWVGPHGAGPTYAKPKRINSIYFEVLPGVTLSTHIDGFRVLNTHFIPSATRHDLPPKERAARTAHYTKHARKLAEVMRKGIYDLGGAVVTMDANAPWSFRLLAPVRDVGCCGTPAGTGTHGRRPIDHVLNLSNATLTTITLSSDHRAVTKEL